MKFLIDEDLPRSTCDLVRKYGHDCIDVRDVGFRGAPDSQIARYAQDKGFCLLTGDFDFSDIRNYPPSKYSGLVVLGLPRDATAFFILNLIEDFLRQKNLVSQITGKLAIVEPGRIRLRKDRGVLKSSFRA